MGNVKKQPWIVYYFEDPYKGWGIGDYVTIVHGVSSKNEALQVALHNKEISSELFQYSAHPLDAQTVKEIVSNYQRYHKLYHSLP